ncbi:hypothetical protein OWV82_008748 [Melia azedarach]|uniref:Uncharacterized protein n=1 Tax=Melia azedarach TaxID=155640 RepID=A0ACC1YDG4_MELAZ|nr:hypothetical protein OWV82_008748 [Melia azedarach]
MILTSLSSSPTPAVAADNIIPVKNQDLVAAMEEMQKANYFTFVMLLNMFPLDQKLTANITFLMPKDKVLSRANLLQQSVNDFLIRHSIPSALLFEHLQRIPSGSLITSSLPDYMLRISNGGRKMFSLNNVRIISPNLCTAGSSIRCHGIDGVLNLQDDETSLHSCSNSTSPVVMAAPPTTSRIPSPSDQAHLIAPAPSDSSPQKSGASQSLLDGGLLKFLFSFAMLSMAVGGLHILI